MKRIPNRLEDGISVTSDIEPHHMAMMSVVITDVTDTIICIMNL